MVQGGSGIDGKRSLVTEDSVFAEDVLLLFTDEDFETSPGVVSSVQFRDYVMTEAQIRNLGEILAIGIPLPGDMDASGVIDSADFATFELELTGPDIALDPNIAGIDTDGDSDLDASDFWNQQKFFGLRN